MSRFTTGLAGAIALVSISGAAQFAMGRVLPVAPGRFAAAQSTPSSSAILDVAGINRTAKADRALAPSGSPASLRTISLTPHGVSDTVILMRVPVAAAAPIVSAPAKPTARSRPMVACEPVVSPLTEVARRLQPGRCVT